jgi:hypothetical protein
MDNISSKATKQQVRLWKATLRNLKMADYDYNVKAMNAEISKIVLNLNNADQEPEDLADHILAAYKKAPCNEFAVFITSLENEADRADDDLDADVLMEQGLTKYDALVTAGEYSTSDPKDAQILALQTQVQNLDDAIKKRRPKDLKDKKPSDSKRNEGDGKRKGREPWQLIPPKTGDPITKTVNGRTFHWCSKPHGQDAVPLWGVHDPSQHKETFKRQKTGGAPKEEGKILEAHAAIVDGSVFNENTDDEEG